MLPRSRGGLGAGSVLVTMGTPVSVGGSLRGPSLPLEVNLSNLKQCDCCLHKGVPVFMGTHTCKSSLGFVMTGGVAKGEDPSVWTIFGREMVFKFPLKSLIYF